MAAPSRPSYERLLEEAARLDVADQLLLLEHLAATLRERLADDKTSITALRGLGKEVWAGVDAQAYVDQERAAWSG